MATELAALGLSADASDLIKAADALSKIASSAYAAGDAAEEFNDQATGAGKAAKNEAEAVDKATGAHGRFSRSTMEVNGSLQSLAAGLGSVAGRLVAMAGVYFGARSLATAADAWSDMSSRVGAAVKDMSMAAPLMQRLTDIANASYAPLEQTVETYTRNVTVLRDLGIEAKGAADFTESLNHMLVITATKGERAAGVQNALSKAMAVGKLQADGLESVLANGGRVAEALAKQLGTTVSGLRAMASEGKITGKVIADALINNLEEVREQAGEMPATIADGITRIHTGYQAIVGTLDKFLGVSGGIADTLVGIGDAMRAFAAADYGAWMSSLEHAAVMLGQALLVLAATRIPALIAGMLSVNTAGLVMTAQFIAGAIASRGMTIAMTAQAVAARGLGAALTFVGGPIGIIVAAAAAMGVAIYNVNSAYKEWGTATEGVVTAQENLNTALENFSRNKVPSVVEATKQAAQDTVDAVTAQIMAAEEALAAMQFKENFGLWETANQAEIKAQIEEMKGQLIGALGILEMVNIEWQKQNEAVKAVGATTSDEMIKAQDAAMSLLTASQSRVNLLKLEKEYGKDSVAVAVATLAAERDIYFAKVATMQVTEGIKDALRQAWWEEQTALGKTKVWDTAMGSLHKTATDVVAKIKAIASSEPGGSWLDTAIAKAGQLAGVLGTALSKMQALGSASSAGAGDDERGSQRPIVHEATGYVRDQLQQAASKGGGGGGGGGGQDKTQTELEALKTSLMSQTELQNQEWTKQQELLTAALDKKLVTKTEYDRLLEEAEYQHQANMRGLGEYGSQQGLANAASFFEGMAALTASGGGKVLALSRGFAAAQGVINSYLAFTEVLRDPSYVGRPWARFAAAAGALAQGLAAVRSIKSGSGSGGGGGAGSSGGAAASAPAAAPSPQDVTLDFQSADPAVKAMAQILMPTIIKQLQKSSKTGVNITGVTYG